MIKKIVSGGQTGVDRAALKFAIARDIPHGGYCPKGRRAEDGRIPDRFNLIETSSPDYPMRTRLNVIHSDGTLILMRGRPEGGTRKTIHLCDGLGKPRLVIDLNRKLDAKKLADWLAANKISTLNIAGPRESKQSGICKQAEQALERLLAR